MLTDTFGRSFNYLRLSITDVCNFNCDYCLPNGYQANSERNFLSIPEIKVLVETFASLGTRKVRITGGEPSLRKDLPKVIETLSNINHIDHIAITTNGYKLSTQLPTWVEAGLTSLNVSIDSLDPRLFNTITGHNKLPEILKGIDNAIALGLTKIKVNSVLMNTFNRKQLNYFLDWVKQTPITVRFIELMQTGDNPEFFAKEHVAGDEFKQRLLNDGWRPLARDKTSGPALEFSHDDYQGNIGLIMPYSKDFCHSCNRLRVSALGKLHLCLFTEQGHDLRHLLTHDNKNQLAPYLRQLLMDKKSSHFLHDKLVGATENFSTIGG
ncbi:GTP 3',8-cyclase MoaA [Thalassotalea ganghwensis]